MMTDKAVPDDRKVVNEKPTAEQVDIYTRRENELRQRYLKGVLDFNAVLDGLQKLMEMTRGCINGNGQPEIPDWADKENPIIQHLPCGMIDPARFATISVFEKGEDILDGEEFIARAQKLDSMNACAFDFYSKPENWRYLPTDVDVIVFPKTIFRRSDGDRCVWCLYRHGSEWHRHDRWLAYRFARHHRVAVLASSAQPLGSKTS